MLGCALILFVSFVETRHELELSVEHYVCMVIILKGLVTSLMFHHAFALCTENSQLLIIGVWVHYIYILDISSYVEMIIDGNTFFYSFTHGHFSDS